MHTFTITAETQAASATDRHVAELREENARLRAALDDIDRIIDRFSGDGGDSAALGFLHIESARAELRRCMAARRTASARRTQES